MKIIIPMTGYGSRFVAKGYTDLKPMIEVQGKPIIEWIIKGMYPNEKDILFVCRKEHLDSGKISEKFLKEIAPTSEIFAIDDWVKKGPVYDILRASEKINDDEPCIINYCDFYMTWDYEKFKRDVVENNCDGALPCYTGFHPNLIPEINVYATCMIDENGYLTKIREKYSFSKDKTKNINSPGVHYFKTGALLKKYCQKLVDSDQTIKGEYYASLPYNFMVEDGLKVWVPTYIDNFCQWGTPEDMEEYLFWTNTIMGWNK